jgi:hypothetical protein
VPNPEDFHLFAGVINFIDDSIVADPYPPIVLGPSQFVASGWPWIIGKRFNARQDTIKDRGG